MNNIPFTQFILPDGRREQVSISTHDDTAYQAEPLLAAGVRFECEILTTGEVSFTAELDLDGEPETLAHEICFNTEATVHAAVCRLIADAAHAYASMKAEGT